MSYQEKRAIVSLISNIVIVVLYSAYMVERYPQQVSDYAPDIFRFWGNFFLILIVVSIVARIVIAVIFSIINTIATREAEPAFMDERDKLIEMKANQNAGYVFILGFLLAMVSLAAALPPTVMFVILLCAGFASEMVSEISQFYFYRRGV